jgi:hypothetical protein
MNQLSLNLYKNADLVIDRAKFNVKVQTILLITHSFCHFYL